MTITNVMRLLTKAEIAFETAEYEVDESDLSGVHAAEMLGLDVESVFKTLVARGDKNGINVFVIPVGEELDLKKCAVVSGNKKIEMIKVTELLPLTGYIRGGIIKAQYHISQVAGLIGYQKAHQRCAEVRDGCGQTAAADRIKARLLAGRRRAERFLSHSFSLLYL